MAHESAYFTLETMSGKKDMKKLKQGLDTLPGVMSVSVNGYRDGVAVDYDNTGVTQAQLHRKLNELGFAVSSISVDQLTE